MSEIVTGGYVRHRDRMVQESVFQDLRDTLIACRWVAGTTMHQVVSPYTPSSGFQTITTGPTETLKLLEGNPINLIDYFPDPEDQGDDKKVQTNTFAIDNGRIPDEPTPMELGSNTVEVVYVFNMAFYAVSDAVAQAMMNDLRDRYEGRIVNAVWVDLYNYNDPAYDETSLPVVHLECLSFKYTRDVQQAAPWEAHLYFAELQLIDTRE